MVAMERLIAALLLAATPLAAISCFSHATAAPYAHQEHAQAAGPRIVHREPGAFGDILVIDEGDYRFLRFGTVGGDDQSMISLKDPFAVPMDYIQYATIGLAYTDSVDRVLMIGLGGGTFSSMLRRHLPSARVDVVEIDPAVVRVARAFFGVQEDLKHVIHVADGAVWVAETRRRYDLILVDAYGADGVPRALSTTAFFTAVRARLAPDGVVVANLSVSRAEEVRLRRNLGRVFGRTACFATPGANNLLIVGRADGTLPSGEALVARARALGSELALPFDLVPIAERLGVDCL